MNATTKLWLGILGSTINGLITAGALFTQLFGQNMTLNIIAGLGIVNIIVGSIVTALSTQTATVKDVLAMPGVEPMQVNKQASPALATMAMDPTQNKIGPLPSDSNAVAKIAASNA